MRKVITILFILIAIPVAIFGLFFLYLFLTVKGPEDFYRNYMANDLICLVDEAIYGEVKNDAPPSYPSNTPNSPELWTEYWNERVSTWSDGNFHEVFEGYVGPTNRQLILYALSQRRLAELPDLLADRKNHDTVESLYAELDATKENSCSHLAGKNPSCSVIGTPRIELVRECG